MSPLQKLQKAYLLGYRRGMKNARRQLAASLDHELSLLQSDYDDIVRQYHSERQRFDQIEAALNATRVTMHN